MPELPEVETVRRGLEVALVGRRMTTARATGARTVRRTSAAAVEAGLMGATATAAERRGKYLLVPLDNGLAMLVHLRMSGQLLVVPAGAAVVKHTHVVVGLDGGDELRFVDPRTFGEVVVIDPEHLADDAPDLVALGPDALELAAGPPRALAALLGSRSRMLKYALTDQRTLAGLGNIYADEVLHRARLAPQRVSSTLTTTEARRLHRSLGDVLGEAIEARGSSLADAQYVDLWGEAGSFRERHRVYGRAGQRCLRCKATVVSAKWAGRTTAWCPGCQT